jgi:hypothetical protein
MHGMFLFAALALPSMATVDACKKHALHALMP